VVSTPGLLAEGKRRLANTGGGTEATQESDEYGNSGLDPGTKRPGLLTLQPDRAGSHRTRCAAFESQAMRFWSAFDGGDRKSVLGCAERVAPVARNVAIGLRPRFANYGQQLNLFPAFEKAKLFSLDLT